MPRTFVSHAQTFEDVMLWRALQGVGEGFYIDVGAYSPDVESVTKAFYDRGWHGINVEPHPDLFPAFMVDRTRDINLNLAVSDHDGSVVMNLMSIAGHSTLQDVETDPGGNADQVVRRQDVHTATLSMIWREHVPPTQAVHFLKVDVEGHEREVIAGNDWSANRPWIVVVEAKSPFSRGSSHGAWEPNLANAGYAYVYGDGLNRFYVAGEHDDLRAAFDSPPNTHFDNFARAGEVAAIQRALRAEAELARLQASRSWRWTSPLRAASRRLANRREQADDDEALRPG